MPCRRLGLDQQTGEWHEWRAGGIGGSDAAAIMGISTFQTRADLLRHKAEHWGGGVRPRAWQKLKRSTKSAAMQRGIDKEPEVRRLYTDLTGIAVVPACCIHETYDWMRSSLDGLNESGSLVIEIKCPNNKDHSCAVAGVVPTKYWPQCQHNLAVTGAEKLHYVSWTDARAFAKVRQFVIVSVTPSTSYIEDLVRAEIEFLRDLESLTGKKILPSA